MLLLIRHAATAGNLARRYIGRTDEPLCAEGIAQARALAVPPADRVYVSPMLRCVQTAQLLYPGAELIPVDGFREMDFGDFEGKTHAELCGDPGYVAWIASEGRAGIPSGESRAAFEARCVAAFRALGLRPHDRAAIVAHGGTAMALLSALGGQGGYYDYQLGNAEAHICELTECGGLRPVHRLPPPSNFTEKP